MAPNMHRNICDARNREQGELMSMAVAIYLFGSILAAGLFALMLSMALRAYLRSRGTRLITCPENGSAAAVEVDARHAALTAAIGKPSLLLKDCSRWPERRDCGQQCLEQIESHPEDCLVRTILTRWYQGKCCVLCGKFLGEISRYERKPALMSPDRITCEWSEIDAEGLPEVLATHRPVCWSCHIAETFRRQYPELITDRS